VTGTAQISANGSITGNIAGSSGLTGTVIGQLYDASPTGMTVASRPNGDIYYGAAALDAQH
jgi:hypothetical protein